MYKDEKGQEVIKPDCLNKITRLSLHEYSFFTREPLKMQEFKILLGATQGITEKLLNNVHLLLSSFAVKMEDQIILNVSIYVQGGDDPKLEVFCKGNEADFISYPGLSYFTIDHDLREGDDTEVREFVVHPDRTVISNNTLFCIQTAGKAM